MFYRNLEKMLKAERQDEANYVTVPKEVFRRLLSGAVSLPPPMLGTRHPVTQHYHIPSVRGEFAQLAVLT